jgi:hypothetical protein
LRLRDWRTFQAWPFNQGLTDRFQARARRVAAGDAQDSVQKTPQDNSQNDRVVALQIIWPGFARYLAPSTLPSPAISAPPMSRTGRSPALVPNSVQTLVPLSVQNHMISSTHCATRLGHLAAVVAAEATDDAVMLHAFQERFTIVPTDQIEPHFRRNSIAGQFHSQRYAAGNLAESRTLN